MLLTFTLQMVTIYVPFLNPIVHTMPLTLNQLVLCLLLSTVVFFAVELEKRVRRHGWLANNLLTQIFNFPMKCLLRKGGIRTGRSCSSEPLQTKTMDRMHGTRSEVITNEDYLDTSGLGSGTNPLRFGM